MIQLVQLIFYHDFINHDLTFKFYLNLPIVYFAMSVNRTVTATPNNWSIMVKNILNAFSLLHIGLDELFEPTNVRFDTMIKAIGRLSPTTHNIVLETVLFNKGWDRSSSLQKNPLLTGSTQNLNTPIGTAIMIRTTKFKRPITCVCVLFSIFNQSFLSIWNLNLFRVGIFRTKSLEQIYFFTNYPSMHWIFQSISTNVLWSFFR